MQPERSQAENLFQENEANLLALIENTQDAIWSVDPNLCLITLNSALKHQFQIAYGVELKPGVNPLAYLPRSQQEIWRSHYERALQGDRFKVELGCEAPGIPANFEVSFNPILTNQSVTGVAVFARDITERKRIEAERQATEEALQKARDQLWAVLDAVPGCVSWFSSDLTYLGINRYLAATFHLSTEEFVGKKLGFMESSLGFAEFVQQFIASSLKESTVEIAAVVDGMTRIYLVAAQKYAQDQSAVFVGLDITDRRRIEEALRESQERYALAMRGANDGLWDWNLKTNEIYFSPRWKQLLGYRETEIGDQLTEWFQRVHPDDLDWLQSQIQSHLQGSTQHFESEHRMMHRDGTYRWMLSRGLAVRDRDQVPYRMAGSQTDITKRKRAEEQLIYGALYDSLTGLANRALFMDRLNQTVERLKYQSQRRCAVLVINLDRFKVVNDSLGHLLGDELLMAIARRLEACVQTPDTLARMGGDEFTILAETVQGLEEAQRLAEKIQLALGNPFSLRDQDVFITASIGIALSDSSTTYLEDLLRNANTAMHRAKAKGRARHELFDSAMHAQTIRLLQLETDLRRAIAPQNTNLLMQEFKIQYQPIVCLKTGSIQGFEALVRWQHPQWGLIPPAEFIPIAEDLGLIIPLGQWILRQACQQLGQWQRQTPPDMSLSISVNLSTRQINQSELSKQVRQILQSTQLDNNLQLKLEITESSIMDNAESATVTLKKLKELGVQLLIDDFGTGYSSLSYLQRFPIDTVKIDRSFVMRLGTDEESEEIVRAIVTLAHNLGMNVIAEGVETANQLVQLKNLGVEYAQGYYFDQPLDCETVTSLMTSDFPWNYEALCSPR